MSAKIVPTIRVRRPRAILLDIEGTTSSMQFYPSMVAPYIRNNTETYLKTHWNDEHIRAIIRDLRLQALQHPEMPKILDSKEGTMAQIQQSAINHIELLYKSNTTTIALLYYQMYVWLDGQLKGQIKTHMFSDVPPSLFRWKYDEKIPIYIYSSARADVQMLMFSCTEYGGMLNLIEGHFDSKIGQKTSPDTYHRIAQSIQTPPQNIIFLTDDLKEAKPAKNVGLKVILVKRERRTFSPIEASQFEIVSSFKDIKFVD